MPAPKWVLQGPDTVEVPILLYHHIAESPKNSQFYVTPQTFEQQMQLLNDWGYTTITTTMLIRSIREGMGLPPHPIVITFDDGNVDNYIHAFPIMKKYGFVGVEYLVVNYIGKDGYMTTDQIRALLAGGWEIGSHTMNHANLVTSQPEQRLYEIHASFKSLEREFGFSALTFAYPFGSYDCGLMDAVYRAGYLAGMGLGSGSTQCTFDLYALHRLAVRGGMELDSFAGLLPWFAKYSRPQ